MKDDIIGRFSPQRKARIGTNIGPPYTYCGPIQYYEYTDL